jgi:hypothetical protein
MRDVRRIGGKRLVLGAATAAAATALALLPGAATLARAGDAAGVAVSEDTAKWESGYGARFYQVVGSVKNQGKAPIGAVKLRVELQDDAGKSVAQGTCWNGAAESLADASDDAAKTAVAAGKVKPIPAGESDKWRCTFLDEDAPKFTKHATAVALVIPAP